MGPYKGSETTWLTVATNGLEPLESAGGLVRYGKPEATGLDQGTYMHPHGESDGLHSEKVADFAAASRFAAEFQKSFRVSTATGGGRRLCFRISFPAQQADDERPALHGENGRGEAAACHRTPDGGDS